MKKILLYGLLLLGGAVSAQTINIPDANFKNRLLDANTINSYALDVNGAAMIIDVNADGELQQSEVSLVWELFLGNANISDATGLEAFNNLRMLACNGNPTLTSLDLTSLSNLERFSCDDGTGLEFLSFAGLSNLKRVFIMGTNLDTIDLTGVNTVVDFSLSNVPLTNLDLSAMVNLSELNLYYTNLTSINLENSPLLTIFRCVSNSILETINIKNNSFLLFGPAQNRSVISNNENLDFICIDEGEEEGLLEYFDINQITPPYMSTTCEFLPGQMYNSISGVLKYDFDTNGCDSDDNVAVYAKVKVVNGTEEKVGFTNSNGKYFMYVGLGEYSISVESENSLFSFTPSLASVNFPGLEGTAYTQDFCLTSQGVSPDVEIIIVPSNTAMPGFDASYNLILRNNGNQAFSGTVTFNFDDAVLDFISASPQENSISGDVITWNYTDLLPFEYSIMNVNFNLNGPTDTPAVNINDELDFTAQVTPIIGDLTPGNNSFELNQIVVGSFDPNNIICLQGEIEDPEAIGEYLDYVINFENTGNAAATFVVVTQQIDETMFDVSSLQLLNSSHEVAATINGNIVEFRFDAINLGGGEQGNITFKMKTKQTLVEGDEVMNSAKIVFDYNFPILTNNATTVFETILNNETFSKDNMITVYPNPTKNIITINTENNLQSIHLYDMQGRLIQVALENDTKADFDITQRASGIYFLKITTDKGIKVEKLIKE